jgi:putrescine transport system substrate-binding protein
MIPKSGLYVLYTLAGVALAGCSTKQEAAPTSSTAGAAAASAGLTDDEKVLNIYNWVAYIAPDLVPAFEKEYGIKVNYDVFDSNEVLETKLLSGTTGYDIVVPSASFMARQIKAGVYQKLDKSLLPNLKNVDPFFTKQIDLFDPGLEHAVNYFWGTSGVGYNLEKIKAAMPDAPMDSFRMIYDPAVIKNFKRCGVSILDAPDEVVNSVLVFLGRTANSEAPEDLAAAEKVLMSIRPYIRSVNSARYIEDLANGEICLALGWSGDVLQAASRAREAAKGNTVRYTIPKEGAVAFYDMLAIPADAPHPRNAHLFINYLLRPEVAARNSSVMHYAVSNAAAYSLIDSVVYNDRGIYPSAETKEHIVPDLPRSQTYTRLLTRMWTRFKSGR